MKIWHSISKWLPHVHKPEPVRTRDLKIIAIISVYQDEAYLERCFQNMIEQGVKAVVIDNDANEATKAIVAAHVGGLVQEVIHLPRPGYFDWTGVLACKQDISNSFDADWFLLWDSDEIREPPPGYSSVREAITAVDAQGYNTIHFDEFVFMPTDTDSDFAGQDYVSGLRTYYFFQPKQYQRMNGWRKQQRPVDLMKGAGHIVRFRGQKIAPTPFVMRHYLILSHRHGVEKYGGRQYSQADLKKGWSKERARTSEKNFALPGSNVMKVKADNTDWDRTEPLVHHPCFQYD